MYGTRSYCYQPCTNVCTYCCWTSFVILNFIYERFLQKYNNYLFFQKKRNPKIIPQYSCIKNYKKGQHSSLRVRKLLMYFLSLRRFICINICRQQRSYKFTYFLVIFYIFCFIFLQTFFYSKLIPLIHFSFYNC